MKQMRVPIEQRISPAALDALRHMQMQLAIPSALRSVARCGEQAKAKFMKLRLIKDDGTELDVTMLLIPILMLCADPFVKPGASIANARIAAKTILTFVTSRQDGA